jgi:peroxiredoxin Q/BCP
MWLVVYFYPKDDTPGCTTEACSFSDGRDFLEEMGVKVVGISKDSIASHAKFAKKYNIDFTLLSDVDHTVIEAYGSWAPKKLFGHDFIGIHRDTYLIDPEGTIAKKYEGVDPKTHIGDIVKDLKELQ